MEDLVQGSESWHAWRDKGLSASDTPAILGKSEFQTAYQYWLIKTKRVANLFEGNFATERGMRWEGAVRARYELVSDMELPPALAVYEQWPVLRASLDGWNKNKRVVLEIKCAGKAVMECAREGLVHSKYLPQVLTQLLCTGADVCHFYVATIGKQKDANGNQYGAEMILDTCLVEHKRDEAELATHLESLKAFWQNYIIADVAPPLVHKDTLLADDLETIGLATALKEVKQSISSIEGLIVKFKQEQLKLEQEYAIGRQAYIEQIEKFKHHKVESAGVTAKLFKTKGWQLSFDDLDEALAGDLESNQALEVASKPA